MKLIQNNRTLLVLSLVATSARIAVAEVDISKLPPAAQKPGVTFAKDIRPLFEASCIRCHSGEKPKAGLRLEKLEDILKGGKEGKVLTPGKSQESVLVIAVSQLDEKKAMPPKFRPGGHGPGGPGGPGGPPPGSSGAGGPPPPAGGPGSPGGPRNFGPPPKPLTPEQVGLVRAWIDQGAK